MRLHEIKHIPAHDYDGNDDDVVFDTVFKPGVEAYKRARDLPGDAGLKWFIVKHSEGLAIFIADPDMPAKLKAKPDDLPIIGRLELMNHPLSRTDAWSVAAIAVRKEYRGKKIGLALYGIVLALLKLTLVSDDSQTDDGARSWANISRVPGVKVQALIRKDAKFVGKHNFTEKGLEVLNKFNGTPNENLESFVKEVGGEEFSDDARYWALPVKADGNRMSNEYVKVYGTFAVKLAARKTA